MDAEPSMTTKERKVSEKSTVKPTKSADAGSSAAKAAPAKTANGPKPPLTLPEGYRPAETEPFMNPMQRLYFRRKLLAWKEDLIRQTRETLGTLNQDSQQHADLSDRATSETDRAQELRARDRQRKLVGKIDAAIARIEDGSYGYCDETGEPIGLRRLEARLIATLSIEAQERHERRERVFRED
jgi:DnaK suppressor protein